MANLSMIDPGELASLRAELTLLRSVYDALRRCAVGTLGWREAGPHWATALALLDEYRHYRAALSAAEANKNQQAGGATTSQVDQLGSGGASPREGGASDAARDPENADSPPAPSPSNPGSGSAPARAGDTVWNGAPSASAAAPRAGEAADESPEAPLRRRMLEAAEAVATLFNMASSYDLASDLSEATETETMRALNHACDAYCDARTAMESAQWQRIRSARAAAGSGAVSSATNAATSGKEKT